MKKKMRALFDIEIIGKTKPVFLICVKIKETKQKFAFWHHKRGDLKKFVELAERSDLTWISFNGNHFDMPILAAWLNDFDVHTLKELCNKIINERLMPWDAYAMIGCSGVDIDHIDLKEVAPGVMISLKLYAGRMHYPTMIDLPFDHDMDLTPAQCKVLENYCFNDLGVTEWLLDHLEEQLALRVMMSETYGIDLRSKSDAQMSEAILKKMAGIGKRKGPIPASVRYEVSPLIKTAYPPLLALIDRLEAQVFELEKGAPVLPEWLEEPIEINGGLYKFGIGGLHSQHDKSVYYEATDDYIICDIDGKSYYPSWIIKAGYVPYLDGKGQALLEAYKALYHQRLAALDNYGACKKAKDKKGAAHWKAIADSLKIALNGAFGKLGSFYCAFYSPDLLIAVTITGQLNLLCLIYELSKQKGIDVLSANTDGIVIGYKPAMRDKLMATINKNSKHTGMVYEEKQYKKLAMKDVNNYIAIGVDGEAKLKGLYANTGLQKNPTMQVCTDAALAYLQKGTKPEAFIKKIKKLEPFLAVRNVKGGVHQHPHSKMVDDWVEVETGKWATQDALDLALELDKECRLQKSKSRPAPRPFEYGGKNMGRVARWYMTTKKLNPLRYENTGIQTNGNMVPKTTGAIMCLTLPATFPADLDYNWYIQETYDMLADMGIPIDGRTL